MREDGSESFQFLQASGSLEATTTDQPTNEQLPRERPTDTSKPNGSIPGDDALQEDDADEKARIYAIVLCHMVQLLTSCENEWSLESPDVQNTNLSSSSQQKNVTASSPSRGRQTAGSSLPLRMSWEEGRQFAQYLERGKGATSSTFSW